MVRVLYHPTFRDAIARITLVLGMIGPGLFLAIDPDGWTTSAVLADALHIPLGFISLIGILLIVGGLIALVFPKLIDFCYAYASIFFLMVWIGSIIALFEGITVGALLLAFPVLIWVYAEAVVTVAQRREHVGTRMRDRG